MSRKSSNDEQAVEGLAFAQLVVFIEEAVTDGDIVPLVFKLADLAQLYVSRMEQLLRVKYDRRVLFVKLFVEPCRPSQRYRVTAASPVCSTEHTCGPTLQTDHIRPSSIFCCGSHCLEQSSCHIERPDNQRCLLPTAFKDSSVRTTASAP